MSIHRIILLICILLFASACALLGGTRSQPLPASSLLAEFSQHGATVTIRLEVASDGSTMLVATFTPQEADGHFYSKDLPPEGVDGIGRPTRLELAPASLMQAAGELTDSVLAEDLVISPDLPALPSYPAGPVTLTLPVTLPAGSGEIVTDQVLITYMVCTPRGCQRPVVGKVIEVNIPTQGE